MVEACAAGTIELPQPRVAKITDAASAVRTHLGLAGRLGRIVLTFLILPRQFRNFSAFKATRVLTASRTRSTRWRWALCPHVIHRNLYLPKCARCILPRMDENAPMRTPEFEARHRASAVVSRMMLVICRSMLEGYSRDRNIAAVFPEMLVIMVIRDNDDQGLPPISANRIAKLIGIAIRN